MQNFPSHSNITLCPVCTDLEYLSVTLCHFCAPDLIIHKLCIGFYGELINLFWLLHASACHFIISFHRERFGTLLSKCLGAELVGTDGNVFSEWVDLMDYELSWSQDRECRMAVVASMGTALQEPCSCEGLPTRYVQKCNVIYQLLHNKSIFSELEVRGNGRQGVQFDGNNAEVEAKDSSTKHERRAELLTLSHYFHGTDHLKGRYHADLPFVFRI